MSWTTNCCDAELSGLASAHCSACHKNFTRTSAFDVHRHYNKCLSPVDLIKRGYELNTRGYWQQAGTDTFWKEQ